MLYSVIFMAEKPSGPMGFAQKKEEIKTPFKSEIYTKPLTYCENIESTLKWLDNATRNRKNTNGLLTEIAEFTRSSLAEAKASYDYNYVERTQHVSNEHVVNVKHDPILTEEEAYKQITNAINTEILPNFYKNLDECLNKYIPDKSKRELLSKVFTINFFGSSTNLSVTENMVKDLMPIIQVLPLYDYEKKYMETLIVTNILGNLETTLKMKEQEPKK